MAHSANDACIVEWSRTLRVDEPAGSAMPQISAWLSREGVRVRFGDTNPFARTYALVEAPESVDPSELRAPQGRWYDCAIIALAIEPQPPDALPCLLRALSGDGAPARLFSAEEAAGTLLIEAGDAAGALLALRIVDAELRRFHGTRKTRLLAPLSGDAAAEVAAAGLQAPEVASGRVLETLLGLRAHVE